MSASLDGPVVTVVVPARNASATLADCLRGLAAQSLARSKYEVIVVVDGRSRDDTLDIASRSVTTVVVQMDHGAGGARNAGVEAARAEWIAFTDADCIPSHRWLASLLDAVSRPDQDGADALGAAGSTIGYQSLTEAARFVDLTGGLRADKHLAHQRYPWAPTSNVMYRRTALLAVGGFDRRFDSYEGCDLHTRLLREVGGRFEYAGRAVVSHRHRSGWRAFWRQQVNYGRGYAQFFLRYSTELDWTGRSEVRAWLALSAAALRAALPAGGDAGVIRRGTVVKLLAQRVGFVQTYWSRREAARWKPTAALSAESSS